MPFKTPAGEAVLVENLCRVEEISRRLTCTEGSVYLWIRNREKTGFPMQLLPSGELLFDYDEVYRWFTNWIRDKKKYYPQAYRAIHGEEE